MALVFSVAYRLSFLILSFTTTVLLRSSQKDHRVIYREEEVFKDMYLRDSFPSKLNLCSNKLKSNVLAISLPNGYKQLELPFYHACEALFGHNNTGLLFYKVRNVQITNMEQISELLPCFDDKRIYRRDWDNLQPNNISAFTIEKAIYDSQEDKMEYLKTFLACPVENDGVSNYKLYLTSKNNKVEEENIFLANIKHFYFHYYDLVNENFMFINSDKKIDFLDELLEQYGWGGSFICDYYAIGRPILTFIIVSDRYCYMDKKSQVYVTRVLEGRYSAVLSNPCFKETQREYEIYYVQNYDNVELFTTLSSRLDIFTNHTMESEKKRYHEIISKNGLCVQIYTFWEIYQNYSLSYHHDDHKGIMCSSESRTSKIPVLGSAYEKVYTNTTLENYEAILGTLKSNSTQLKYTDSIISRSYEEGLICKTALNNSNIKHYILLNERDYIYLDDESIEKETVFANKKVKSYEIRRVQLEVITPVYYIFRLLRNHNIGKSEITLFDELWSSQNITLYDFWNNCVFLPHTFNNNETFYNHPQNEVSLYKISYGYDGKTYKSDFYLLLRIKNNFLLKFIAKLKLLLQCNCTVDNRSATIFDCAKCCELFFVCRKTSHKLNIDVNSYQEKIFYTEITKQFGYFTKGFIYEIITNKHFKMKLEDFCKKNYAFVYGNEAMICAKYLEDFGEIIRKETKDIAKDLLQVDMEYIVEGFIFAENKSANSKQLEVDLGNILHAIQKKH